jgi:regulator of sigma E protease
MTIIAFILILALLVLIHEFGHFLVAKKNGIYVEEFGFGYPPRIFGIKIGETLYSLNLIPIGGFVKLYGEEYHELKGKINTTLKKRAFSYKTPLAKASVIIAGVIGNFLLGWLLISYLFTQGVPTPTNKVIIESVTKNSPAAVAGIKPNDIILEISTKKNVSQNNLSYKVKTGDYLWKIAQEKYNNGYYAYQIAKVNKITNPSLIHPNQMIILPLIQETNKDGDKKYNFKTTDDFIRQMKNYGGKEIYLTIQRNGKNEQIKITPRKDPPNGQGPLGVVITSFTERRYIWYKAPFYGLVEAFSITKKIIVELIKTLVLLVTFQKPKVDVTGPIGIAQFTGQAIKFGQKAVLELIALLSLNLAVVNVLPFPALDGGHLVFIVYEWITKKRVNQKLENYLNLIGFFLLISLAIVISINDVVKLLK